MHSTSTLLQEKTIQDDFAKLNLDDQVAEKKTTMLKADHSLGLHAENRFCIFTEATPSVLSASYPPNLSAHANNAPTTL